MALVLEGKRGFILTKRSVILCPHGGMVMHIPMSVPGELINGEAPLLLNDFYSVVGCPHSLQGSASGCMKVQWSNASIFRFINGVPVLIHTSTGICQNGSGIAQGAAVVSSYQTRETD